MVVHAPRRSRRRHPRRCSVGYAACRVRSPVPSIRQTASGEFNTPTAKGVKPTGPPIQQTPSGEFDLAGVESICQTRSGESGSMEPGGRFWRIWNAPPPQRTRHVDFCPSSGGGITWNSCGSRTGTSATFTRSRRQKKAGTCRMHLPVASSSASSPRCGPVCRAPRLPSMPIRWGRRFPRLSGTATPRPSTALETVRGS